MSYSTLTVDNLETSSPDWANEVRDRVTNTFVSASTRDSAVTSPVAGALYHLSEDDTYCSYTSASTWKFVAGPPTAYKTADEVVNASTTLQNDNHLAVTVAANAFYEGELYIAYTANASAGLKVDFTAPASATMRCSAYLVVVSGTTIWGTSNALGSVTGITATGAQLPYTNKFTLETSSTAGTLQFRWAQNASHASDLTVHKGSYLRLRRIG